MAVGIIYNDYDDDESINMRKLYSDINTADIRRDPLVEMEILDFIKENNVKSVVISDGIMGCPHEEGIDYPEGTVCPECPFWANRDRFTGEVIQ